MTHTILAPWRHIVGSRVAGALGGGAGIGCQLTVGDAVASGGTISVDTDTCEIVHTFTADDTFLLGESGELPVTYEITGTGTFDGDGSSGSTTVVDDAAVTVASGSVVVRYDPADFAGGIDLLPLSLLLEARLLSLADNDPVAPWTDFSGNGRHAVASVSPGTTAPVFKTGIVNGHPVVRFNGSSSGLDLPSSVYSGLTSAELFIVFKVDADPPGNTNQAGHVIQMTGDATSSQRGHLPFTDGAIYEPFGTTARKTVGNPAASMSSQFRCYNVRSAAGAFSAHLDATSLFSTGTNTVGFNQFGPFVGHARGSTDTRWLDGDVALIAISPVLSSGDRTIMQTYITDNYGISF